MATPELVKVEALAAFTLTTTIGQFHGDPNSHLERGRFPSVPADRVDDLVKSGRVKKLDDDLSQLDHDGDGEPGGSDAPQQSDDLTELRKHYKEVVGKNPFPGWDATELNRRIDEAQRDDNEGAGDDVAP